MDKKEFLYQVPHLIFKEVAKDINQLVGLSKTSAMIANLFSTLPMTVEIRHMTNQPKPSKKLNALDEFVHAYLKHDDSTKVYLAFFYNSEKQLNRIAKAVKKHPEYFAYLYMREALKLTRRMNTKTHYRMMSSIIKSKAPQIPVDLHYKYSIAACNSSVNYTIKELFRNSRISGKLNKILVGQEDQPSSGLSETANLEKILNAFPVATTEKLDEDFDYIEELNMIVSSTEGSTDGGIPIDEAIQTNLGESLETKLSNMSRGTGSASIFEEGFSSKKVKTGWFKKLAGKFNKEVYHITNTFKSQWSSLNSTYRHKFKAPKAHYEENKLAVVLSVDHSGSVSTEGLQKLLYLFEKRSKQITKLVVLIHDTEVVKEFDLEDDFDITSNPQFKEALANRFAVGGTSNLDVFKHIDKMLKDKVIDPDKTIYICFGDMYSDIPEAIKVYPSVKRLSTTWLSVAHNPVPDECGGTNISMS